LKLLLATIIILRGERVMLDHDLAELYGVETAQLKRAVRRNRDRFPDDFMFELSKSELDDLRCQFGTSKWGGTRYIPSENDSEYSIGAARAGSLNGTLKGHNDLALLCVPPTRLAGPCRTALTQMLIKI
jgi:hypothetical protein